MTQVMNTISPLDVAWLFVESDTTPMHVGCVQIFDRPPDAPADFVARFHDALLSQPARVPPYTLRMHRQGLSLPSWEAVDGVDLEYHVQRWAVPPPGDDTEFNTLVARLHGEALDLSRPLWEFHLIEGLAENRIAVYNKMHHSVVDGIGGMQLLQNMLSVDPAATVAPPWSEHSPVARLRVIERAGQHDRRKQFVERLKRLTGELKQLPGVSESLGSLAWAALHRRHSLLQAPYTAPRCVLNQRVSRERDFATVDLRLGTLRAVAGHAGVSINDVLLAACAGALRRHLADRGALPHEQLLAGLPVSVRPQGDAHMGTALTFIIASLGTDLADARDRLGHIHESTRAAKQHVAGLSRQGLTEYTLLMMAPFMTELLTGLAGRVTPAFNIIISNVPGPSEPLYYNGARMRAMYPLSIVTHGQALNITALGYQDTLHLGLTCCRQRVPGVQALAAGIEEELDGLGCWAGPPTGGS